MNQTRIFSIFLSLLLVVTAAHAVGGKWTPEQLLDHDPDWLMKLGLEIPAQELWSPGEGGLLEAVVQVRGCSSGFVSPQGMLITNHHCVFGILQHHSTAENDIIASGYLAEDAADELPGPAVRASIPSRFTDVTDVIAAAVGEDADHLERFKSIEAKKKALVATCEERENRRCKVAVYDDGVRYTLIEAIEYPDVRLVYAPPRAVGEYGGDIDNWMWPRHTGDFSLLRVYTAPDGSPAEYAEENVPLAVKRHLQVAREGVSDGSFVMVVGYPGRTYRRLTQSEMRERHERYFPTRAVLYQDWMAIMAAAGETDEEARIAMASRYKSLANREKNARGQVAAIDRGDLVGKKVASERKVLEWIAGHPEHAAALDSYRGLESLAGEALADWDRSFLLGEVRSGALPLSLALTITRWAMESEKPDVERRAAYQERNRARARSDLERAQRTLHAGTDAELMTDWWRRLRALPVSQRIAPLDAIVPIDAPGDRVRTAVDHLLALTSVMDEAARLEMFGETPGELRARKDPLIDLAFDLQEAVYLPREETGDRRTGARLRLRPAWRRAVEAHAGRPVDPDANGTLRVSLAHVKGYSPREAIWMTPLTTVAGVVEKHTGTEPFDAPEAVLEHAAKAPESRWADPTVGNVAVGFLATGDTTGGSSGSPVLNGRGELVGVNFDRVWENIANDFGYNPDIARNVTADVRYMLWMLEEIEGQKAERILDELGLGVVADPLAAVEVEDSGIPAGQQCADIDGLDRALRQGIVLVLGELHGTRESPAFVGEVVCQAVASRMSVTLALELLESEMRGIETYLASSRSQADREQLVGSGTWSANYQDGRTSEAILDLIDRVAVLGEGDRAVAVELFDRRGWTTGQERDQLMAEALAGIVNSDTADVVVVLTGNIHSRVGRGTPWSESYEPMTYLASAAIEREIVTLDVAHAGGTAWICNGNELSSCGVKQVGGHSQAVDLTIELGADLEATGHHGRYHVGVLHASPPAARGFDVEAD